MMVNVGSKTLKESFIGLKSSFLDFSILDSIEIEKRWGLLTLRRTLNSIYI